ncbi:MAG: hypothetical protein JW958_10725 [Candidatus Eisenbacteria bacterium]|nr:hypothetical protein [Candidatus Eisenbacteria bacterium]
MVFVHFLLVLAGYAGTVAGFRLLGGRNDRTAWAGVTLLFGGFLVMFAGVLLAFAPRFFE